MSSRNLPPELLNRVFQLLPRSDIYQCIYVCKSWFASAIQEYYKEIALSEENTTLLRSKLSDNSFGQFFSGGHLVKRLKIFGDPAGCINMEPDNIVTLLSYLPNLKTINYFAATAQFELCANILHNAADNEECLNNIQEITIPFNERGVSQYTTKAYFLICHKLHSSITHLVLSHSPQQYSIDGQSGSYLRFLPDFTKLTYLSIYDYDHSNGNSNLVMFSFLNMCPTLIGFDFKSGYHIPDSIAESQLKTIKNQIKTSTTSSLSTQQRPHKMQRLNNYSNLQLKSLNLEFPRLTKPYMDYIMQYVNTAQLDTFNIDMTDDDDLRFDEWIQGNDNMETVMEFARHLKAAKNLYIYANNVAPLTDDNDIIIRRKTTDSLNAENSRFWKFISNIKGDRDLYCRSTFYILDLIDSKIPNVSVKITNDQKLELEYATELEDGLFDETLSSCLIPLEAGNDNAGPKMIDSLDIYVESEVQTDSIMARLLQKVLSTCPRIVHFCIEFRPSYNFILVEYPIRKKGRPSHYYNDSSNNKTLTKVSNRNEVTVFQSILTKDLLDAISDNLPNIETLECINCNFHFDEHLNTTLNLKNIQYLDHIVLHIDNIPFKRFRNIFIQFKFTDDAEPLCYKSEEIRGGAVKEKVKGSVEEESKDKGKPGYMFVPTTSEYIQQFNRFTFLNISVITILCGNIKRLTLKDTIGNNVIELIPGSQVKQENLFINEPITIKID